MKRVVFNLSWDLIFNYERSNPAIAELSIQLAGKDKT